MPVMESSLDTTRWPSYTGPTPPPPQVDPLLPTHKQSTTPADCICDATETKGMPPVTRTNDYNASPVEVEGCVRTNQ